MTARAVEKIERIGIFDVLYDDVGKYHVRRVVVRCTICGTVAERAYSSVQTAKSKSCQQCPRRLAKNAIVALLRERGELKVRHIERLLNPKHARERGSLVKILAELIESGEVVRFHPKEWTRTWMYAATHLSDPNTTGVAGAASASRQPSDAVPASHSLEDGISRRMA